MKLLFKKIKGGGGGGGGSVHLKQAPWDIAKSSFRFQETYNLQDTKIPQVTNQIIYI